MKKRINFRKYHELFRYLFVSILSTTISLITYYLLVWFVFNPANSIELQLANIISWAWAIVFGYIANRVFVFHSENQNILKEIFSYICSRAFTLILDMAIMFLGVTILKFNDLIIKLISQILIIIIDYTIIKKLVFKKQKILTNDNSLFYLLLFMPFIDIITSYFAWNNLNIWIGSIIKGLIFIYAFITIIQKETNKPILLLIVSYFILTGFYLYTSTNISFITYITMVLKVFTLPILILYFNYTDVPKINRQFLVKIFYCYVLLLLIPKIFGVGHNISEVYPNKNAYLSFFYSGNELSATLLCLLPIILKTLKDHHNWFAKLLGMILIIFTFILLNTKTLILGFILSIIYLIYHERKNQKHFKLVLPILLIISILMLGTLRHNFQVALDFYDIRNPRQIISVEFLDKVILSSRLTYFKEVNQNLPNQDLKTMAYGLGSLTSQNIKNIEIDILDMYYSLGFVGLTVYLIILIYALKKSSLKGPYAFGFYLTLIVSFLSGHILTSAMTTIWLATLTCASKNHRQQPAILMVSNMYPSKKYKHYGAFVQNMTEQVKKLNYTVDLSIMHKHQFILTKLLAYIFFYTKTYLKALFCSYDFIYVHFISHSTAPVLFGYRFTTHTKLILNAHGNDVISDYEFESKNCQRSSKYLQECDLVVCSSTYFKKQINLQYNFPLDKIIVYPAGGVDLTLFKDIPLDTAKKALNLDLNTNYIGLVTRIEKDKGYDTLLEALYLLKEQPFMQHTKLLIIGSGNEQNKLDNLIHLYHLEDYVIQKEFVYQQDLVKYYNAFDVLIFPTKRKSESLGLVGLEAMACETFVIGCNLYGPSEYLIDHENSLTYSYTNTGKQLAQKILEYYNLTTSTKNKIIKNAKQTVVEFSSSNTAQILKDIFKGVK